MPDLMSAEPVRKGRKDRETEAAMQELLGGLLAPRPSRKMRMHEGLAGSVTPASRAGMTPEAYAWSRGEIRRDSRFDEYLTPAYQGAADVGAMQAAPVIDSGKALYDDPSLANLTDLGVKTGAAMFSPSKALGALGAGYGAAATQDFGLLGVGAANAGKAKSDLADLPGLTPEQNAAYRQAYKDGRSGAMKRLEEISAEYSKGQGVAAAEAATLKAQGDADAAAMKLAEYDRAVLGAEQSRDKELAKDRRFSDTEMGKIWDKTGGWGPALVGAGLGSASRLATGGGSVLKNYGLPAMFGGIGGAASNNIPLAYNAFSTEPDNPERRAYEAYSRDLPPDHPRKAEWANYARGLEKGNPVREAAAAELYDQRKMVERMLMGGIEGVGGAALGADLMRIPGRMTEGAAAMPGRATKAYRESNAAAIQKSAPKSPLDDTPPRPSPPDGPTGGLGSGRDRALLDDLGDSEALNLKARQSELTQRPTRPANRPAQSPSGRFVHQDLLDGPKKGQGRLPLGDESSAAAPVGKSRVTWKDRNKLAGDLLGGYERDGGASVQAIIKASGLPAKESDAVWKNMQHFLNLPMSEAEKVSHVRKLLADKRTRFALPGAMAGGGAVDLMTQPGGEY